MLKRLAAVLVVPFIACASQANAGETYPQKTLVKGSVFCFERSDWDEMIAATFDDDADAAGRLVIEGKCRQLKKPMRVSYLDPSAGGGALIQLPSGKTAYTHANFLAK
ncbi:hypothetical protein EGJ52_08640 [Pseudomonas luteola]|uniref:hypothetical protein n=1 Tax=Pseudomonas luteola TaxID=47886 RepID=UPI000F78902F|nr:hypothetical protein [Pseudomonas luteola]RRW45077.1 hypothetical protein EGJ52_08640 [Pseudomonas luteola]